MRHARPVSIALAGALLFAWFAGASAQQQGPGEPRVPLPMQPAPPGPYKAIPVKLPPSAGDASFEAFRKDLGEIAKRKDRVALAGKVVAKGFFWQREDSNEADPKKSGIDNLASAVGLDAADGSGWQALASYASDPSSTAVPEMKGVICAPGVPTFDERALEKLSQTTRTDPMDWGYPTVSGVEVRADPQPGAAVVDKLEMVMVRILPDESQASAGDWVKLVTPSGKVGYALASVLAPVGSDQLCYQKEGGSWKIAGYIGGGGGQE
jgi:hypothetical protein